MGADITAYCTRPYETALASFLTYKWRKQNAMKYLNYGQFGSLKHD